MEYAMEPDLNSVLQAARENRPSDFQSQVNDLLGQRIIDALDRRRQEMAAAVFTQPEEVPDEIETEVSDEINSEDDSNEVVDTQIEEPNGQDA